ncbi:MAG: hypothetical protein Q8862_07670 [Bacteroidota bacterium]|nr:hypothetical protein [Bacteroidota bacterium]MDP4206118.1 hypothetical protein [Bacteroidota bacterium]
MKKINITYILAGFLLMGMLNSCEDDNNNNSVLPMSVSFDNATAKDSAYAGDAVTITGTAKAAGQIQMIRAFSVTTYDSTTFESEVTGSGVYHFDSDTTTTANYSITIPNITANTIYKIKVTDKNGNTTATDIYTVTLRKSNINVYSNLTLGGWDSNYGSCLDVDTGTPYGSSAMKNAAKNPLIDLFFDNATLTNIDLDAILHNFTSRLSDTGIRYAKTPFTSAQFDAMKGDDLFKDMTATLTDVNIAVGDVIFFTAKSGKKGLLRVKSMTDPLGDLVLDEKIQK